VPLPPMQGSARQCLIEIRLPLNRVPMIGQLRCVLRGENQTSLTIDVESNT